VSALAGAQRPIITLAVAAVTFVLVYRLSAVVARSRSRRYYRQYLPFQRQIEIVSSTLDVLARR